MPQRVNIVLAGAVLLLGLAGASLFRRPMPGAPPADADGQSSGREAGQTPLGSGNGVSPGEPGAVPPTAIPAYSARRPDHANAPLPVPPRVPATPPAAAARPPHAQPPVAGPRPDAGVVRVPPPTSVGDARPRAHIIVDGDTLPRLAAQYLGNAERWREILETNREVLSDPEVLRLGAELRIPPRGSP